MILRKIPDGSKSEKLNEVLLVNKEETESIALGYVSVDSGKSTCTGLHDDEEEVYVILKGRALLMIGDEEREVGPGSVAYVPRNRKHKMTCLSDEKLEYLYFANWPQKDK